MALVLNMPGHLKSLELVPNQCKIFKKAFQKIATHTCGELSLGQVLFYMLSTVTSQISFVYRTQLMGDGGSLGLRLPSSQVGFRHRWVGLPSAFLQFPISTLRELNIIINST